VLANVEGEPDPAVAATLLQQARTAASRYAPDGGAGLLTALADTALEGARSAPAGSDLQLTRARAFAAAARGPVQAAAVASLLDGSSVLPGLTVDTELRWHLLVCLAALGKVDDAAVDAELARDDTAAGRLHALTAQASMPTAEAKQHAWERATGDASLSNHETSALVIGFWRYGQDDVLAPYVDRYVAELPSLWTARTPQLAGTLAERLFPSTLVRQDVLDRTAALEQPEHPAGLRRYVSEGRSDLARAVHARG
jgi:aminopeptidase N